MSCWSDAAEVAHRAIDRFIIWSVIDVRVANTCRRSVRPFFADGELGGASINR